MFQIKRLGHDHELDLVYFDSECFIGFVWLNIIEMSCDLWKNYFICSGCVLFSVLSNVLFGDGITISIFITWMSKTMKLNGIWILWYFFYLNLIKTCKYRIQNYISFKFTCNLLNLVYAQSEYPKWWVYLNRCLYGAEMKYNYKPYCYVRLGSNLHKGTLYIAVLTT